MLVKVEDTLTKHVTLMFLCKTVLKILNVNFYLNNCLTVVHNKIIYMMTNFKHLFKAKT